MNSMDLALRPISWNWNLCPVFVFIPDNYLSIIIGITATILMGRIAYLLFTDYFSPRDRNINIHYSKTINGHIKTLPLKDPMRIAHIGDNYCSLLGAENFVSGRDLQIGANEYDVIVVQEQIGYKKLINNLKDNGYLIVISWPDRQGNTKILRTIRMKEYYERKIY